MMITRDINKNNYHHHHHHDLQLQQEISVMTTAIAE